MKEQESIPTRQSTRIVTATRRREMAEEKARILGHKRTPPTALEVAAAQWQREREAGEEKAKLSLTLEMPPFSVQQVSVRADGIEADEEAGWKAQASEWDSGRKSLLVANARGVSALSRRLMALERKRTLRRKPMDLFTRPRR